MVRGEINEKTAYIQADHLGQSYGSQWEKCQAEGEAKVV